MDKIAEAKKPVAEVQPADEFSWIARDGAVLETESEPLEDAADEPREDAAQCILRSAAVPFLCRGASTR
jgi:hypothetical protein